jgi:glycosyltransferase 2 family protein
LKAESKVFSIKIAGYLISLLFLYLTFKDIDFEKALSYLYVTNYYYLIAAVGFNICFFITRSFYQINNLYFISNKLKFIESLTSIGIAQFYNVILPARMGELIRTYFLSKLNGIKKATVLSYILVEKVIDVLLILTLLLVIIVFFVQGEVQLFNALSYLVVILSLIIVVMFLYIRFNKNMILILKMIFPINIYRKFDLLNEEIFSGLHFFKSKIQIIKSILLLLLSWICILAIFGLVSYPFVELLDLPLYSCLVFMVFSALSLSIPSAPGGIGVVHFGLYLAVTLLGGEIVDTQTDIVAAFVISTHFFVILLDVFVGGSIMIFYKINYKKAYSE